MPLNVYATLPELRRVLALAGEQTADDDLLLMLLGAATELIDAYTGRRFVPVRATRSYTAADPGVLGLEADLLALESVTNGDGTTIPLSAVHVGPAGAAVGAWLALDRTRAIFTHSGDPLEAIQVTGVWGYHPDWAQAWASSGDSVQDNPLAADATTLTVDEADAPLPTGFWARFAVGQLLRIEDEYLHVLAIAGDALTVARGVNGTTAASHAAGTPIAVYQVPGDIRAATLRLAMWLYRQPDAGFVQAGGALRGSLLVPPALPEDVRQILAPYVRLRVG